MIRLEHATKKYGGILALRDVSFQIPKGQIVGLLGRNGAGKTTALNLMTGYFPPTEGVVRVGGMEMMTHPRECKRLIGYLPERPPLYDEMTVTEYLAFVSELREVTRRSGRAHIEEIIELCALGEMRGRVIGRLSKGYRQRVGIAQALCGSPEILILDEPTVGLDPQQIAETRELIRLLAREHTVVFSSHILPEVQQLCARVIILHEGRLVSDLELGERSREIQTLRLRTPMKQGQALSALRGLGCVLEAEGASDGEEPEIRITCRRQDERGLAVDQVFRLFARMDMPLRMMREEAEPLEEIFLRATEGEA